MPTIEIHHHDTLVYQEELQRDEPVTVGRHGSNTVIIDHDEIPLLCARVLWNKKAERFELTPVGAEKLYVNGKQRDTSFLKPKRVYLLGSIQIKYHDEIDEADPGQDEEPDGKLDEEQQKQVDNEKLSEQESPVALKRPVQDLQEESVGEWLRKSRRPGEKTASRSPMVTTLVIVSLFLFIGAGGVYFLIGRQTAQLSYQAAKDDRDQRKYAQAITKYDLFLTDFPTHKLADVAKIERDLCQIDGSMTGAGSSLEESITAINDFVEHHRSRDDFRDWYSTLASYAYRVALDGYRQASRRKSPNFLELGDQGRQLFSRFQATDGSDSTREEEITEARRQAEKDLLQHDVKQQSLAALKQANSKNMPLLAFEIFRNAAARYSVFESDPEFVSEIQQALKQEQGSVTQADPEIMVITSTASPWESSPQVLLQRQANRLNVESDGQIIWFMVAGRCYAVDRMTGMPEWSLTTGSPVAFHPIEVSAKYDCWLLPVSQNQGMALVRKENGEILWRQKFAHPITSSPTVHGNSIYVVTSDNRVTIVNSDSGTALGSLLFPQSLSASVAIMNEQTLCCVADQDVFYFINRQTSTCEEIKYTGHAAGTITTRPLLISDHILYVENDQLHRGKVEIAPRKSASWKLESTHQERLPGLALGDPILWGDRLFMEMNGPQVAVWKLSDVPGTPFMTRITNATIPASEDIRLYLYPFEGDRLFVAGDSLRALTVLTSSFDQELSSIDLGQATQAIQGHATHVYMAGEKDRLHGRELLHFNARDQETYWQLQLGSSPHLLIAGPNQNSVSCIDAFGELFDLKPASQNQWTLITPREQLFSNQNSSQQRDIPLISRDDAGSRHVAIAGKSVAVINSERIVSQRFQLEESCTVTPVLTSDQILWASDSGVHLTNLDKNADPVKSWLIPEEQNQRRYQWKALIRLGQDLMLAVSRDNQLHRFSIRIDPVQHLALSNSFDIPAPVVGTPVAVNNQLLLLTSDSKLLVIDPESLIVSQEKTLAEPPANGPWTAHQKLFLETETSQLVACELSDQLPQSWACSLNDSTLACNVIAFDDEHILACLENGRIWILSADSGEVVRQIPFDAAVSCLPLITETSVVFGFRNGTVQQISKEQLLSVNQTQGGE